MDDLYERPSPAVYPAIQDSQEDVEGSSDEEDGGPDWTRLPVLASSSSTKPVIPKRGDKEFEPIGGIDGGGKGTDLQQHRLGRMREAMFSALDVERTVSSKIVSYAVWYPDISRARILDARGSFLITMGHNVPRQQQPSASTGSESHAQKKAVELLPEEALYLIERGSLFCWSRFGGHMFDEGAPMSLQQAYAEMIGREELTLERYQVYTYLKRLGYTVTRARPPDPYYYSAPPFRSLHAKSGRLSVLARLAHALLFPFRKLLALSSRNMDWWRPLRFGYIHRFLSYSSLFSSLRFIPSGYGEPLRDRPTVSHQPSPYEVFFHLYKPATPYRKTAPSPPDFSVIVVNARTTPMPTLQELCALFEQLPEPPPPTPRKRPMQASQSSTSMKKGSEYQNQMVPAAPTLYTRLRELLRWLLRLGDGGNQPKPPTIPSRRPNPFQLLKMGKKMIVVAAVDSSMISFFRFCQGSFDEWPMI